MSYEFITQNLLMQYISGFETSQARERGDGRCFFHLCFRIMSYSGGRARKKSDIKMVLSRLFYKRLFSMFQLKVLNGGNNGRLILAKDDLR